MIFYWKLTCICDLHGCIRCINENLRTKERCLYLDDTILEDRTLRTSLEEESIANNLANASKVEASEGTSKDNDL